MQFNKPGLDGYALFERVLRRPNERYWEWIIDHRRREVQDTIFGWLEHFYTSDSGLSGSIDWVLIIGGPIHNDWNGLTSQLLYEWGFERKPKYVAEVLYAFEKYCDRYFTHDGKVKRTPPVVPPYPRFDHFLRDRKKSEGAKSRQGVSKARNK